METKQYFNKYLSKLNLEALLKSILSALIVGSAATFVFSAISWFASISGAVWIAIGVLIGITLAFTPLFYFKRFRTTVIDNARRLDKMGLEERLITMVEYENDSSFIAAAQRADAKEKLDSVKKENLKIIIPKKIWIPLAACFLACAAMTTVSG